MYSAEWSNRCVCSCCIVLSQLRREQLPTGETNAASCHVSNCWKSATPCSYCTTPAAGRNKRVKPALSCVWCLGQLGGYGIFSLSYTKFLWCGTQERAAVETSPHTTNACRRYRARHCSTTAAMCFYYLCRQFPKRIRFVMLCLVCFAIASPVDRVNIYRALRICRSAGRNKLPGSPLLNYSSVVLILLTSTSYQEGRAWFVLRVVA